jgi:hypothetical protein
MCYLEQSSQTPASNPTLTPEVSYCYELFVVAKKLNSFTIKQIHTL